MIDTTNWLDRIRNAWQHCKRNHEGPAPFAESQPTPHGHIEQLHHGTTDFALAAWHRWRDEFRGRVRFVRGEQSYLIEDLEGNRTIAEPALAIERDDGKTLFLTGCSWGYGGEGPHGTAAILADVSLFSTMREALRFVAGVDRKAEWALT